MSIKRSCIEPLFALKCNVNKALISPAGEEKARNFILFNISSAKSYLHRASSSLLSEVETKNIFAVLLL